MHLEVAVAGDPQDAEHLDRISIEIAAGHRQQLALRQHEAGVEQRLIGLRFDRRRAERRAQDRRFQNARQAGNVSGIQEVVAHEPLDAVLFAVPCVTLASAHDRLHVERQPIFRAARHVMQVEPHCPLRNSQARRPWRASCCVRMPPEISSSSPIVCVSKT